MVSMSHRIFVSRHNVIEALATDLSQYDPSPKLLDKLGPMVLSPKINIVSDPRAGHYWICIRSKRWWSPMRSLNARQLRDHLVTAIRNLDPADERLPDLCRLVFNAPAYTDKTHPKGLWIETGMEKFHCRQCGQCCRSLDYHDQLTQADVDRWRRQGRTDILDWVETRMVKGKTHYRIWVKRGTPWVAKKCPWLGSTESSDRNRCRIQETKPKICRRYPGSRKHALKTGCKGFET